jgi:hypothetical protein
MTGLSAFSSQDEMKRFQMLRHHWSRGQITDPVVHVWRTISFSVFVLNQANNYFASGKTSRPFDDRDAIQNLPYFCESDVKGAVCA